MGCDARTAGEHPGTPLSRLDPGVDDIALGTRGKSEIFAIAVALSHGPLVNIVPGPYASTNGVHRLGERATTGTGHPVLHRLTGHPESLCDLGTSHEIGNEANDAQPLHLQLRHRSTRSVLERAPLADHRHEVVPRVISPGSSVELVDELIDEFDATAGTDHTGHDFVTVVGKGRTFEDAARAAVTELQVKGLCIIRLVPDLVTRSEIAERLGVTRQAVQHWVTGSRRRTFPKAVNPVGGGVWSWHDVHEWAVAQGHCDREDLAFPTSAECDVINAWIESGQRGPRMFSSGPRVTTHGTMVVACSDTTTAGQRLVSLERTRRAEVMDSGLSGLGGRGL